MNKLNVKKGDTVFVIPGKDKGKQGKVLAAYPEKERVVVEKVAMITKHVKPRRQGEPGGRIEKEGTIHVSNVMVVCPKCKAPTRVGHVLEEVEISGKKKMKSVRVCKRKGCGAKLDWGREGGNASGKKADRRTGRQEEGGAAGGQAPGGHPAPEDQVP